MLAIPFVQPTDDCCKDWSVVQTAQASEDPKCLRHCHQWILNQVNPSVRDRRLGNCRVEQLLQASVLLHSLHCSNACNICKTYAGSWRPLRQRRTSERVMSKGTPVRFNVSLVNLLESSSPVATCRHIHWTKAPEYANLSALRPWLLREEQADSISTNKPSKPVFVLKQRCWRYLSKL